MGRSPRQRCIALRATASILSLAIVLLPRPGFADEPARSLEAWPPGGGSPEIQALLAKHPGASDRARIAAWLKDRVDRGETPDASALALVGLLAGQGKTDDALDYLEYFISVELLDSQTCPDPSNGDGVGWTMVFASGMYTKALHPSEARIRASVGRAMALESATATKRRVDPSLCDGGRLPYSNPARFVFPDDPRPGPSRKMWSAAGPRYFDDPAWRAKRNAALPFLADTLLTLGAVNRRR